MGLLLISIQFYKDENKTVTNYSIIVFCVTKQNIIIVIKIKIFVVVYQITKIMKH